MALRKFNYVKLDDSGRIIHCPTNDNKGEITGKYIIGLQEYFDENPAERIRLGWIKHILHRSEEIEYNKQTQYLEKGYRQVDEYTIEDEYTVLDKTEEMMLLEDMLDAVGYIGGGVVITGMEDM